MKVAGKLTVQLGISSRRINWGHTCMGRNPAIYGSNAILRELCALRLYGYMRLYGYVRYVCVGWRGRLRGLCMVPMWCWKYKEVN
jgi:hypothetical protein